MLVMILLFTGCQLVTLAGGELKGEIKTTENFAFAADHKLLRLEVNPASPYSVWLRVTVIDGHLYIDAAERRKWHKLLQSNPAVRIKLGDNIYLAEATVMQEPAIAAKFLSGRTIYKIIPRQQ